MSKTNIADKIYEEYIRETNGLISIDMSPAQIVGELTRALKRVINNNGGTAITVDGVGFDKDGKES